MFVAFIVVMVVVVGPIALVEKMLRNLPEWHSKNVDHDSFAPFKRIDGGQWSRPRLYLGAVLLLPFRFLVILCVLIGYVALSSVVLFGYDRQSMAPLRPNQLRILKYSAKAASRLLLFCFGFIWIKTSRMGGKLDAPPPSTAPIIVSNHISWLDILYMIHAYYASFVAKGSVRNIPFIGTIAVAFQSVFVNRLSNEDRKSAADVVRQRQLDIWQKRSYPQLVIFAEGTTTNGVYLLPFKRGPFMAGLPVLPVVLKYPFSSFSVALESIPFEVSLVLTLCQFYNNLEATELPVYVPSDEEKADWSLYAGNVRKYMAAAGGLKLSECSYEDKLKYFETIKRHLQIDRT